MELQGCPEAILRCPTCKGELARAEAELACRVDDCGQRFPIVHGRPVLIDEARSIFSHASYRGVRPAAERKPTWRDRISFPSVNLAAARVFATMRARLAATPGKKRVLVVGAGVMGKSMQALHASADLEVIDVDPSPTSAAALFCDGHDLPFADGSIHAVVTQAVLEHVADPHRCVAEIHRVLAPGGLVYAETPFMQQVHMKGFDFTRFTHLGHRRLFRWFREVESGMVAGPATALAWSLRYLVAACAPAPLAGIAAHVARVVALPIEQIDHLISHRPAALDGASCTYFLGERADVPTTDREVIDGYRGAQ